jgi:hypothetical protein
MPRDAQAREWWADVYEVRERIERRRARETASERPAPSPRRGVREIRTNSQLSFAAHRLQQDLGARRRRPRPRPVQRIGPRPDRIAAWAVALGVLLLLLAILSAH